MTEILKTQNKEWGFWGTGKYYLQHKSDIKKLWDETAKLTKNIRDLLQKKLKS